MADELLPAASTTPALGSDRPKASGSNSSAWSSHDAWTGVNAPEPVQPARVGRVGMVDDAILKRERAHARGCRANVAKSVPLPAANFAMA